MHKKICVMTGTRAEYGVLRPTLFKLRDDAELDLQLLVTGTHLDPAFGDTQQEIRRDGFAYDPVRIPVECATKAEMARSTAAAMSAFSCYFETKRPDLFLVLGDRYEAFAAAAAAYIESIPIAHISGGDVTEGALDDGFRHCITKMSTIHFPGCEDSARRIIQMGEQPSSVYSVGEPGLENCLYTEFWPLEKLEEDLHFQLRGKSYAVVTFHPVTQEQDTALVQLKELIRAMDAHRDMQFIITTANADAGGCLINAVWNAEKASHENWLVVHSLGMVRYLSAVKHCCVVIGNSSSGIIEAPALGVPTVNIGDRQKGRMMADSVICCAPVQSEIQQAIALARSDRYQEIAGHCDSPFGKGDTSGEIVRILRSFCQSHSGEVKKKFYDMKCEV